MDIEKDRALCAAFPKLYAERDLPPQLSCMSFGFECGDGWYQIIWDLSTKLAPFDVVVAQVKEKFGLLRIYLNSYPDGVDDILAWAEEQSGITCEDCGNAGKRRPGGWIRTLCDECDKA